MCRGGICDLFEGGVGVRLGVVAVIAQWWDW
jgi:hypothetical protein